MKSKLLASFALAGVLLSTSALSPIGPLGVQPVQAQSVSVNFDLFFTQLEPHGVWVRHPQYRYVFCPTGVDSSWRPYTRGRWLYLEDRGWYFASDEPFAWATYHYGRWLDDDNLGWCWVPGTKWAPAWVSWRQSDNIVGWAPLPPEGEGYAVSVEVSRDELPEGYWVYVPTERFVEPQLSASIVLGSDQPDYYAQTQFLGPVVVEGDVVTNNVIEVNYIEQHINQQVTVYNAEEVSDPVAASVTVEGQTVQVFDQDVAEPTEEAAPAEAVDEAEAPEVIATEGGSVDAEGGKGAQATPPAAGETPETDSEMAPEPATPEAAPTDEASPPAAEPVPAEKDPAAADPAAPATEEPAPADQPATTKEPASADDPAAAEPPCPPETMVDGACPPETAPKATDTETVEPAAPAAEPAEAAPAAPAAEPEAQGAEPVAPEAVPEAVETAPAEGAADSAEEPAEPVAPADVAPATPPNTDAETPPCPPETMVDGACPPAGGEPTESQPVQ